MKDYLLRKLALVDKQTEVTNEEFESLYKLTTEQIGENRTDSEFVTNAYKLIASITQKIKDAPVDSEVIEEPVKESSQYKDSGDKNQFNWGGVRSSSKLIEHAMKPSPMFCPAALNTATLWAIPARLVRAMCNG